MKAMIRLCFFTVPHMTFRPFSQLVQILIGFAVYSNNSYQPVSRFRIKKKKKKKKKKKIDCFFSVTCSTYDF